MKEAKQPELGSDKDTEEKDKNTVVKSSSPYGAWTTVRTIEPPPNIRFVHRLIYSIFVRGWKVGYGFYLISSCVPWNFVNLLSADKLKPTYTVTVTVLPVLVQRISLPHHKRNKLLPMSLEFLVSTWGSIFSWPHNKNIIPSFYSRTTDKDEKTGENEENEETEDPEVTAKKTENKFKQRATPKITFPKAEDQVIAFKKRKLNSEKKRNIRQTQLN